jgi:hypothetical protein
MRNPIKRNKNIGTSKQGHGQENRMVIPEPLYDQKIFWSRLGKHRAFDIEIQGKTYSFLVEETLRNHAHACTVEDLIKMIHFLPPSHLEGLKYIVLRQPKRKEQILNPVWGRLIYFYEYKENHAPAIILEAIDYSSNLIRDRKMRIEEQEEFERLVNDGHNFQSKRRKYVAAFDMDKVRNTQLYRTFLHEAGHYYHYLQFANEGEEGLENYEKLSLAEKEKFAHTYTEQRSQQLKETGKIPFERILTSDFLGKFRLRKEDFEVL